MTCNLSMTCALVVFIHNKPLRLAQNLDAEQEPTRDFCQRKARDITALPAKLNADQWLMRSMIVPVAIPPPQHIVCRP